MCFVHAFLETPMYWMRTYNYHLHMIGMLFDHTKMYVYEYVSSAYSQKGTVSLSCWSMSSFTVLNTNQRDIRYLLYRLWLPGRIETVIRFSAWLAIANGIGIASMYTSQAHRNITVNALAICD